jgi:hypothetical protein
MKTLALTIILVSLAGSASAQDAARGHFSECAPKIAEPGIAALGGFLADPEVKPIVAPRIGCEETTPEGAKTLSRAKTLDVPADVQPGGSTTCGFHVLRSMMRYWDRQTPGGSLVPGMSVGYDPIYNVAQSLRVAYGGWANAFALTVIAGHYGYAAQSADGNDPKHRDPPTFAGIRNDVENGRPVAALICVDEHGCPVRFKNSLGGHWCVIEGFVTGADGKNYIVVKHPWRAESFLWSAADFEASWNDLNRQVVRIAPTSQTATLGVMQKGFDSIPVNRHN